MANPNINVWGATYNGVTGVTLPTSGGGTATFPWVEGSETKTQNGTYDVTNLAEIIINVAGGGGSGLTYETGTYTPAEDISRPTINWTNTHTEAPVLVAIFDTSSNTTSTTYSNIGMVYADNYKLWGVGYPYSASAMRYAVVAYVYRGSGNASGAFISCNNNSDNTGDVGTNYPRYWVTPTGFHPSSNSTSRYWRQGRNYKWIAVWKP